MTTVSVVVPWRAGDPQREQIWEWCLGWWKSHYSHWQIVTADSGDVPFTRGRSINEGVARADGDIIVIADADTVASGVLEAAKRAAGGGWALAYEAGWYLALTPEATGQLLATNPAGPLWLPLPQEIRERHPGQMGITSYSGVLAVHRLAFEKVGGFDPRHYGWGCEDQSFYFAMETIVGPCRRASGFALAPWHVHDEAERFDAPWFAANDALCRRYEAAYLNPEAMVGLIDEARAWTSA